ncbi:MAG: helix-turn-helix domain-containing protein [Cyanobacteriota bacterium]
MREPAHSLEALGSLLQQTREARGLTLTEVANDTFIRSQYLQALEQADLSRLPEPVYVQGFLKRYADYLQLDGEALARSAFPLLFSKTPHTPAPLARASDQSTFALRPLHLWAAYVVLIVLTVGGLSALLEGTGNPFAHWVIALHTSLSREEGSNPPSARNTSASGSPPQAAPTTRQLFPTLDEWTRIQGVFPEVLEAYSGGIGQKPVRLDVRVVEHPSWLRVIADGQTVFEATLQPGAELNWEAEQSILLRAGNAGGVLVTFNDRDLGVMGKFGEVKEQIFEPGLELNSLQ